MLYEFYCGRKDPCGFRAHGRYFATKPIFTLGICPRCNGPVAIVEAGTEKKAKDAAVDPDTREIVGVKVVEGGAVQMASVAAATATVGYDLLKDELFAEVDYDRVLVAAGLAGSAAALDTKVRLMVGSNQVGTMYNTSTGAPNRDDMFRVDEAVPKNTRLRVIVTDAPATNPINFAGDIV